jgi:hypothetical protein
MGGSIWMIWGIRLHRDIWHRAEQANGREHLDDMGDQTAQRHMAQSRNKLRGGSIRMIWEIRLHRDIWHRAEQANGREHLDDMGNQTAQRHMAQSRTSKWEGTSG